MSSYNRRLEVEVVGSTAGFTAAMNRVNASLTRVGSGLRGSRNEASVFSNQIRAIGTTARYYLAGQLVFGVMRSVQSLAEFKTQLGEIDALAAASSRSGNFSGLGNQLADVGSEALLMSNKFGIAVTEVETYMQRFYTAFRPTGSAKQQRKEMQDFVSAHLALVTMLGSRAGDPNQLAGGLAALVHAMPGGREHPGQAAETLSNYFARIITRTPQLTGQDIASAAGRLASAKTLSHMTMPQLLAAFGVAAETGGSPAVIIRGMTQLLGQSLLHPTKPASLRTYQAAGLPTDPNALAGMGGERVLERLIHFVQQGGPPGSKARALNLDAIYNAFSRQESVRQFVNLIANGGVPALKNFQTELKAAAKENLAARIAKKRLDQSALMRMQQATHNLGISLVSGADWPLEHLVADPIIGLSNLAARHRTTTNAVVAGGLTLGAGNALRRLGVFSRMKGLGRFFGAATGIEQAAISGAISKEELPAAIAGGAADGSRSNPLWVIISPLSWSVGSPGGFSSPTGPHGGGGGHSFFSRFPKVVPLLGRFGTRAALGAAGEAAGVAALVLSLGGDDSSAQRMRMRAGVTQGREPRLYHLLKQTKTQELGSFYGGENTVLSRFLKGGLSARRAETMLKYVDAHGGKLPIEVNGEAHVDVAVHLQDATGHDFMVVKKGVPVKLWGAQQFPTAKGKPKSKKAVK